MLTRAIERVLNTAGLDQHCLNNVPKGPHDHRIVEHDAPPSYTQGANGICDVAMT